ncbi:MAG: cobalamin-dependent protein [Phycisphaerae bacterium]|nr:cobalamin-dependent protein [Phycisphaerae bacterium]
MKVKLILPALTEALSPHFRAIKYSLFPPLGLATLAGYLDDNDEIEIVDEHVETLSMDDEPDLVAIQAYITSAGRAYEIADHYRARGVHVCLGGLHVTAMPDEAAAHADTIFCGPGEYSWPAFLKDFRQGNPGEIYLSNIRSLTDSPPPRRDLIKRHLYLTPNTMVVSHGCPHHCEFCYKDSFYSGGKSFYTMNVDQALGRIDRLPERHVYFLDDHLFGDRPFASELFEGMRGMGKVWQGAGTVESVLRGDLVEKAARAGLRSLFIGFETLDGANLTDAGKHHNLRGNYSAAIRRLGDLGVMINASFVFGMDHDGPGVFQRTVDWAIEQGIETATFHILTPYPGTRLFSRLSSRGRITTYNWNLYNTRHAVFRPERMSAEQLESGYSGAYENFYRWSSILRAARTKPDLAGRLRHLAYAGGWKKLEPLWNLVIKSGLLHRTTPLLESVLSGFGRTRTPKHKHVREPAVAGNRLLISNASGAVAD